MTHQNEIATRADMGAVARRHFGVRNLEKSFPPLSSLLGWLSEFNVREVRRSDSAALFQPLGRLSVRSGPPLTSTWGTLAPPPRFTEDFLPMAPSPVESRDLLLSHRSLLVLERR